MNAALQTVSLLRAIVVIIVVVVMAIVALAIFGPENNTSTILQIVAVVAPTTAALLTYLNSQRNTVELKEQKEQLVATQVEVVAAKEIQTVTAEKVAVIASGLDGKLSDLVDKSVEAARVLSELETVKREKDRAHTHTRESDA